MLLCRDITKDTIESDVGDTGTKLYADYQLKQYFSGEKKQQHMKHSYWQTASLSFKKMVHICSSYISLNYMPFQHCSLNCDNVINYEKLKKKNAS